MTKEVEKMASKEISAALSCQSYGYKAKVLINGVDVGIAGGKSESKRLLNQDSSLLKEAAPALKRLFCLKKGNNDVSLEFSKTSGSPHDSIQLSLELTLNSIVYI